MPRPACRIQGERIQPLPNVEVPHQLVGSPNDRPAPAGFGPLDISWPQRNELAGTHDQYWLENLFPGFARDIDWGIHNIAATDQQREGFWAGGERYQFDNLHPSKAILAGELPQFRARVFVSRSHRAGQPRLSYAETKAALRVAPAQIEEVPLALQTLWFRQTVGLRRLTGMAPCAAPRAEAPARSIMPSNDLGFARLRALVAET
jgi:hypothetical protein